MPELGVIASPREPLLRNLSPSLLVWVQLHEVRGLLPDARDVLYALSTADRLPRITDIVRPRWRGGPTRWLWRSGWIALCMWD